MTLREAIDKSDRFKPNQYSDEEKVTWLSTLDAKIFNEILMTHEPVPEKEFTGYTMDDITSALIVPFPYDNLYVDYLNMQIDLMNEETTRYNNSLTIFEGSYQDYAKHVNKTQRPVFTTKFRIW